MQPAVQPCAKPLRTRPRKQPGPLHSGLHNSLLNFARPSRNYNVALAAPQPTHPWPMRIGSGILLNLRKCSSRKGFYPVVFVALPLASRVRKWFLLNHPHLAMRQGPKITKLTEHPQFRAGRPHPLASHTIWGSASKSLPLKLCQKKEKKLPMSETEMALRKCCRERQDNKGDYHHSCSWALRRLSLPARTKKNTECTIVSVT
jgi:hypothetical protein